MLGKTRKLSVLGSNSLILRVCPEREGCIINAAMGIFRSSRRANSRVALTLNEW